MHIGKLTLLLKGTLPVQNNQKSYKCLPSNRTGFSVESITYFQFQCTWPRIIWTVLLVEYDSAEMTIQGHSRSLEMAWFKREHLTSYNCSMIITALSVPFQRYRKILTKNWEFSTSNPYLTPWLWVLGFI